MEKKEESARQKRLTIVLYALFVVLTSFFTYMYRYDYPQSPFWDEPYHIASAQKYLNGVFFMEPHPPLGKLLIAAGEKLVHANPKNNQFINTDYATNIPATFSFTGYRLFPAMLAWLTAPILFFIFLFLAESAPLAALLSFLYIFNNTIIVHSRAAMFDSPLVFFGMICVLAFLHLQKKQTKLSLVSFALLSLIFGASFGFAMTTKVVSLIFILLVPALLYRLYPSWKKIFYFLLCSAIAFVLAYCAVWQIHFSLSKQIIPELADAGFYQASPQYKNILKNKTQNSLSSFPFMLRDSLRFVDHYSKGVPRLDLCKSDENGSPAYFWPFGARTINYRWEQAGEGVYRYMYLVPNPVIWLLGLVGIAGGAMLLVVPFFFTVKEKVQHPFLILTFMTLYIGYMVAVSQITRVMYLYHYFLPLIFSFLLFALVVVNLRKLGSIVLNDDRRIFLMTILGLFIFIAFQWYRPLSYYEPISDASFTLRNFFQLWELSCVRCEKKSGLVVPTGK